MPFPSDIPSQIPFVSFLQYATKVESTLAKQSRLIVNAIKNDGFLRDARAIDTVAERIKAVMNEYPVLQACFPAGTVLVPLPRSSPLPTPGVGTVKAAPLWPTKRLCDAFVVAGVAKEVQTLLLRARPVLKSATAPAHLRPKAEAHYDSLQVEKQLVANVTSLTLVDDVVTRGATMFAAALRLREAFPGVSVYCFAAVRTRSGEDITTIRDPVAGVISIHQGETLRRP